MSQCFIGRQPIFNRNKEVYGYELLYRSSQANEIGETDLDVATSQIVMNAFVEIGLENIVGQRLAFFNMTRQFLVTPELMCIPPEQVVLEIPVSIVVNSELVAAVQSLYDKSYTIALDGYSEGKDLEALAGIAEIVKLDASSTDEKLLQMQLNKFKSYKLRVMAKHVETSEQYGRLLGMGFDYFQGRFLSDVKVISGQRLATNKMAVLRLLTKVSDPKTDVQDLIGLISQDPSLGLRVLRFVNSPLSGLVRQVDSIHQGVMLLGRDIIKNWVMLLTIANLDDTVPELITTAFVRARLCEQIAKAAKLEGKESYFTVGLFSLVDAMMGLEMETLLSDLPFTDEVKTALLENHGDRGRALTCVQSMEIGSTEGMKFHELSSDQINDLYLEALQWADQTMASMST